jgi:hypothetical protein
LNHVEPLKTTKNNAWVAPTRQSPAYLSDVARSGFSGQERHTGGSYWVSSIVEMNQWYLVGGAITILKNMIVNGKDDNPHMKWKIKTMFQTTNQVC